MKTALILLVGEQPAPNLLPARHIKPDIAMLVHTDQTREDAERLKTPLSVPECFSQSVDPYHLPKIQSALQECIEKRLGGCRLVFNLTGGTKPMSLAAFQLASQRKAPFVYFQTARGTSLLYWYSFAEDDKIKLAREETISETITLREYLLAKLGSYTTGETRNDFEKKIHGVLKDIPGLEVLTSLRPNGLEALEVDFVVRLGNQIGVAEAKAKGAKTGIDQLQAVAEQRYLGTYITKFLISGEIMDDNNKKLAKAYKINVVELTSCKQPDGLSDEDCQKLQKTILSSMGGA